MNQYDLDHMKAALTEALNSDDASTQNGAVLVNSETNQIVSHGHNTFPNGVTKNDERWQRPTKYFYTEHAERNSIYDAAYNGVQTNGLIMYCPWFACADCARGIIQAGIREVVGLQKQASDTNNRWDASIEAGMTMLKEKGIVIRYIDHNFGIILRRNGELVEF